MVPLLDQVEIRVHPGNKESPDGRAAVRVFPALEDIVKQVSIFSAQGVGERQDNHLRGLGGVQVARDVVARATAIWQTTPSRVFRTWPGRRAVGDRWLLVDVDLIFDIYFQFTVCFVQDFDEMAFCTHSRYGDNRYQKKSRHLC